jgi:glycosyltransferase involved in cell wall biosynthesis
VTPIRVAYLVSHPIQYQVPLLRRLAAHPEISLHVYYMNDLGAVPRLDPEFGVLVQWDLPLMDGYAWSLLRNVSPWPRADHFLCFIHPEIVAVLRRERYDALIVHGYNRASHWLAFLGAWVSHTPILLRGESAPGQEWTRRGRRPLWVALARGILSWGLLRRIHGALSIGALNREFYRNHGVPESRIFFTPYAVDNDRFTAEADRLRPARADLRRSLGLPPDRPVILYAGKLIAKKRPQDLLEAYAEIAQEHPAALVFLGDGSERGRLAETARRRGLSDVLIAGFVNQSEVPRYYAAADLLVLPSSHEPWGLVLNEAMCFGLPVIASDAVGAAPDLVHPGENGWIYAVGDTRALAAALRALLEDPGRRARMGARSREIVTAYSYEADVRGILDALRATAVRRQVTPQAATS